MTGDPGASEGFNGHIDVGVYRKLVKEFIDMRRFETALFWAEKVAVLSDFEPRDIYYQAQCMFLLGEFHRAAHTLQHYKLEKTYLPCFSLLIESLYAAKEFKEAVVIIQTVDVECMTASLINQPSEGGCYIESNIVFGGEENHRNKILASICYIKGKIYEAMDNRGLAMDFYVQALHKSVFCFEALSALVKHEMLMAWEEKELMEHLPFIQQSTEADAKLIIKLYESKLKKYYENISVKNPTTNEETPITHPDILKYMKDVTDKIQKYRGSESHVHKNSLTKLMPPTSQAMSPGRKVLEDIKTGAFTLKVNLSRASSLGDSLHRSQHDNTNRRHSRDISDSPNALSLFTCLDRIGKSTDVMASNAEKYFYDSEYKKSLRVLNELLKIDPYHKEALTIQIGCLIEFGDFNKLFYVAHKLVDQYPDKAISWYAVGCYYDLIGKSDPARRYLSKATSLDRLYGPAWLAYGHSFAKENEHDQAMAAYFKATQLMRGCHLPLLYIGVECGLTKNVELAEKFFFQAMSIAPLDVFVMHELGVIKYEYDYFDSAAVVFRTTVDIIEQRAKINNEEISTRWEPLYVNLGHCCRKLQKYEEALEHFQFALLLKPQNPTTYTAMGFVYALMWNLDEAINYFHKSLAINRDCIVTSTILKTCIEDLMDEECNIDDICGKGLSETTSNTSVAPYTNIGYKSQLPRLVTNDAKYNGIKLKFDEDEMSSIKEEDSNMVMDLSFDL